jgi:hypothetical protein
LDLLKLLFSFAEARTFWQMVQAIAIIQHNQLAHYIPLFARKHDGASNSHYSA